MRTLDAISKKKQELSLKLRELQQKHRDSDILADIAKLRKQLGALKHRTPAQRRAGW